jgi:hypothetical protein
MSDWFDLNAKRYTPADVLEDLVRWTDTLETFDHTRLIWNPDAVDIGWVGDASTSFGIGVVIGWKWAQLKILKEQKENLPKRNIAWLETVAVRVGLIMLYELNQLRQGSNVVVWTNNTTTDSVIEKQKSKDDEVNEECKVIQDFLIDQEIDLTGKRVKSHDNIADSLSRGIRGTLKEVDRVRFDLPTEWETYLCQA